MGTGVRRRIFETARRGGALTLGLVVACAVVPLTGGEAWAQGAPAGADLLERYRATPGPFSIETHEAVWVDRARTDPRPIPIKAYTPELTDEGQSAPIVIVSQHLGHTKDGMSYLATHLASWGYAVVVLEHPSTSKSSMALRDQGQLPRALATDNRIANVRDIAYAITEASRPGRLATRVDPDRVAVVGHGFGSYSALQTAGMRAETSSGPSHRLGDGRVGAVVAMSPDGTIFFGVESDSFDHMQVPILYMSGTQDRGRWTHDPTRRREPFALSQGQDLFFWSLHNGMSHFFTDDEMGEINMPRPPGAHEDILGAVTAFLDAYLLADPVAHEWLTQEGPVTTSDLGVTLEQKNVRTIEAIEADQDR
ncbi:MAG: hypothetical protein EA378_01325 [Phycisphaerales bacterium]|nr:MAG: hypothetical protein EA378_01325 [Phycisphaerales bacterium]